MYLCLGITSKYRSGRRRSKPYRGAPYGLRSLSPLLGRAVLIACMCTAAIKRTLYRSHQHHVVFADPATSRCLAAFTVALNQACDRQHWYTSTAELQLASLPYCVACRNVTTLRLTIDGFTPQWLLAAAVALPPSPEEGSSTRVPLLRARAVTWERTSSVELRSRIYALTDVEVFMFGRFFNSSIADVVWPRRLAGAGVRRKIQPASHQRVATVPGENFVRIRLQPANRRHVMATVPAATQLWRRIQPAGGWDFLAAFLENDYLRLVLQSAS